MFCNNCGKEIREDRKFCTGCGAKQGAVNQQPIPASQAHSGQYAANAASFGQSAAMPKQIISKKMLLSIMAGVVALAIVITGFATSGFGLIKGRAQNPVALMYDGVNGLLKLDSFSFSFDGRDSYYGASVRFDGYLKYGKSVDDIVLYADGNADGYSIMAAIYQGNIYSGENGHIYCYSISEALSEARENLDYQIEYVDQRDYYSAEQRRKMKEEYQRQREMMSVEYINSYLKSGHIDRDKLIDTLLSTMLRQSLAYTDEDSPERFITEKSVTQAFDLLEAFIHSGLEDDNALRSVLSGVNKTENGKNTTYTCSVDFYGGTKEIFKYLTDNYEKYDGLKSTAENLLNDRDVVDEIRYNLNLNIVTVPAALTALRDLALGEISYMGNQRIEFAVTVDNKGNLHELNGGFDRYSGTLKISDHNKVKIDEGTLKLLESQAGQR